MFFRSVRILTSAVVLLPVFSGCALSPPAREANRTVASVDLQHYMGRWFAIASLPAWFQKNCLCVTAEYSMQKDYVAVINTCRKGAPDGPLKVSTAKAFVVPGTGDAKLKVQFFWPFKGDYWIIALDEHYRYAMVGHPHRRYLWILSRTPALDEGTYERLVETAGAMGYDVQRLQRIPQVCNFD